MLKSKEEIMISVVIVTHNVEQYILQLLHAIVNPLKAENRQLIEIIITDDCSTDNTTTNINEFIKKHTDIQCMLHVNTENKKFAGAGLNFGLRNARGKYIHFIDGDDIVNGKVYNDFIQKTCDDTTLYDIYDYSFIRFDKTLDNCYQLQEVKQKFKDEFPYNTTEKVFGTPIRSYLYGTKIISHEFLIDNNIIFDEKNSSQDKSFFIDVYKERPIIQYLPDVFLFYRCGIESISTGIGLKKFIINQETTKELIKIFPDVEKRENNWQIYLLTHSKITEMKPILKYLEQEKVYYEMQQPTDFNYRQWHIFFCNEAIITQNKKLLKFIILNNQQLKDVLNTKDYKVSGQLASKEIQDFFLLKFFVSLYNHRLWEKQTLKKMIATLSQQILIRKIIIKEQRLNIPLFLTAVKELYEELDATQYLYFNEQQKLPLFIRNKDQEIAFYHQYLPTSNIKFSILYLFNGDQFSLEEFVQSYKKNHKNNTELVILQLTDSYEMYDVISQQFEDKELQISVLMQNNSAELNLAAINGSYIVLLDEGTVLLEYAFECLTNFVQDEKIDLIYTNYKYIQRIGNKNIALPAKNVIVENVKYYNYTKNNEQKRMQGMTNLQHRLTGVVIHKRLLHTYSFPNLRFVNIQGITQELIDSANLITITTQTLFAKKIISRTQREYPYNHAYKQVIQCVKLMNEINNKIRKKTFTYDVLEDNATNDMEHSEKIVKNKMKDIYINIAKEEDLNEKQKHYFYKKYRSYYQSN